MGENETKIPSQKFRRGCHRCRMPATSPGRLMSICKRCETKMLMKRNRRRRMRRREEEREIETCSWMNNAWGKEELLARHSSSFSFPSSSSFSLSVSVCCFSSCCFSMPCRAVFASLRPGSILLRLIYRERERERKRPAGPPSVRRARRPSHWKINRPPLLHPVRVCLFSYSLFLSFSLFSEFHFFFFFFHRFF